MSQHHFPHSEFQFIQLLFSKLNRLKLIGSASSIVLGQALYLVLPVLLGFLIDAIFVKSDWNIFWLFLFPIGWALSYVFVAISRFFNTIITQDVRKLSKEIIFKYLVALSNNVYANKGAGEVESLMQELSFSSRYMFAESFPFFIRIVISVIISILTLYFSSTMIGLLFIVWLLVYVPISYLIAKRSINHVSKSLISSAEVSASTVDIINNHELIPAFGTEKYETAKFQKTLEKEWRAYVEAQLGIDRADLLQQFLLLLLPFGIVLSIVLNPEYLKMSPGDVVSLLTITLIVIGQIRDFGKGVLAFFEIKERMKTALNQLNEFQDLSRRNINDKTKIPTSYDITFEKVGYVYETNHSALKDVSLSIKENEKIGIIGYSGAGKSTLMKILRGFNHATSGEVYIGGISVNEIESRFLAENISEVSQTIPLFHRSIRENIAYGSDEVADDTIWQILRRAQIHDYIKNLPHGLDTKIGVKGSKLSGGERARLAIARAFLKDSKIIILDEATASLDSESEALIQKSLAELMTDRTVIAIAHRLSTVRSMDRILMFENGCLVANGKHEELLRTNESYQKLWNMQVLV
jgi:ABC-type multidrug transport system fused ATPase/permease subunit